MLESSDDIILDYLNHPFVRENVGLLQGESCVIAVVFTCL